MAHYQQLQYVKTLHDEYPEFFHEKSVIEIGSWDANGSVRGNFLNCNYIGVDIAHGPGVDLICQGQDVNLPDMSFDTVISCECFEHNPFWKETFSNMVRLLKPGGMCIVTCATLTRKEHGTKRTNPTASLTALNDADDYYCNLREEDFKTAFKLEKMFSSYYFFLNIYSRDLYFFGFKKSETLQYRTASANLIKKIKSIKRKNEIGVLSIASKNIKFWYSYLLALIMGEKKYHDWKHKNSLLS